jgi:hypothetical protein
MRHRPSASSYFITIAPVVAGCLFLLASGPTYADDTPIPLLSAWESNMTTFGRQICNKLVLGAEDRSLQLDDVYYDGERVYYQIATYTGDPTWKYCAGLAESLYRDGYAMAQPTPGKVAGWMNFTKGLLMDYEKTGDATSRDTVVLISQNASFASDGTPLEWTADTSSSREVAYAIMAYLNAESAGAPRRARLADMVNQSLGHIDQWFVSKTAPYVRPFMVGITMQALIQAYDATQDSRIPNAVKTALDGLWPGMWLANCQCFQYTNVNTSTGGMDPAPDLNLVIAPAYAWMYYMTGETKYRDWGDQIFAGGVTNAQNWLYLGKQFDQSYWWSPAYVTWRKAAQPGVPSGIVPTTTSTGTDPSVSMANTASTPPSTSMPSKTLTVITAPTIPSSAPPAEQPTGRFLGKLKKLMDKVR